MTFQYFHNEAEKTVYRLPVEPDVIEKTDSQGMRTGWVVQS